MGPTAYVTETEALIHFRARLCTFADQAKEALHIIDHEIQRTFSFLDEKMRGWQVEARHAEDEVIQAKIELNQRQSQRNSDCAPETTFQEKALGRAQARLEFAQEKLAATKRWQRDLPHELLNYQGPARQLRNVLDGEVPRMIAFLERKIAALEAYLQGKSP